MAGNRTLLTALVSACCVYGIAGTGSAKAVTISDTTRTTTASYFGSPETQSYGESIQSPGGALQSFTLYVDSNANGDAIFRFAPLTGTTPGAPIYQSAEFALTNGANTWSGLSVPTVAGTEYLGYVTVYGTTTPAVGVTFQVDQGNSYSGGQFLYYNQTTGQDPTGQAFNSSFSNIDLDFSATFGPVSTPEPATTALLGAALAALAVTRRRKH